MMLPESITLRAGDAGEFVAELQRRLAKLDFYPEAQINGSYDATTVNCVRAFQTSVGLKPDGIAGPATLRRINTSGDTPTDVNTTSDSESSPNEEEDKEQELIEQMDALENERKEHEVHFKERSEIEQHAEKLKENPFGGPAIEAVEQQRIGTLEEEAKASQNRSDFVWDEGNALASTEVATPPAEPPPLQQDAQQVDIQNRTIEASQEQAAAPPPPAPTQTQEPTALTSQEQPTAVATVEQGATTITNERFEEIRARIEPKLAPPTREEVKQTGDQMLKKGVREDEMQTNEVGSPSTGRGIGQDREAGMEIG